MQEREIFYQRHPDPMWIQDPATLRILDANEAALAAYGYPPGEFLAMTAIDLLPPGDIPYFQDSLRASRAGRSEPAVFRHLTKSGEVLFVQSALRAANWKGRPAELVSVRDISRLIASEQAREELMLSTAARLAEADPDALKLAEQSTTLRTARRLSRMGMWKYEFWSGRIFASAETCGIYGVAVDPDGTPWEAFRVNVPPVDLPALSETYRAYAAAAAPAFEFSHRVLHPDGRTLHVRGVGELTQTVQGLALTGVIMDVTHEVEQDRRLKLLDLSVRRLNDMIVIFEAGHRAVDPHAPIVYANPAFFQVTGLEIDDVIGRPVSQVLFSAAPNVPLEVFENSLSRAVSLRSDLQLRTRDSRMVPAEVDMVPVQDDGGAPAHWVAMIRDMSDKFAAEERARSNEARYQMLSRSTQDVVWDWDFETGRIDWNENFRTIAGDPDALLKAAPPSSWINRLHPDDRERVVESFIAAAAGDAENWSAEYRFMRDDGGVRFVFDRGFVSRSETGKALHMVGNMVDITDQKVAEMRLAQSEKLEALGQITGGVAHDFNNLLAIILGNAETLLDRTAEVRDRRLIELISSAAERGRDLTGRLLAFSRRSPIKPVSLDLNGVILRSAELFGRILRANIRIEIETSATPARIEADPSQLELVLLNLAVNARDAMLSGGTLHLSTQVSEMDGQKEVVLVVADTGTGMDADTLRRCLEPFYTTKAVGKGVGLGLSMAFGFMAQSGGRLGIESQPGQGTRVTLHFPYVEETAPAPVQAEPLGAPVAGGDEHILLVEDDAGVRAHVEGVLSALGYSITSKVNADEAIAYLEAGGEADLLLTDLVMPGSASVLTLVDVARSRLPDIAVLYSSGYPRELVDQTGRLPPDIEFLPKPFRRSDLATHLRRLLDQRAANAAAQEPDV
ncbi:PAS domain-containing protein [Hyphomonas sp.]|uniref:hybrid sensor histidine kinase/response regulator n=1 Tax=Hyphomonas sp. TaxID=87 RepID=UPI0025C39AF8|nr:PAS domain-containing protein [Hyphomonas sp.]MBI1400820.1 PAS domain-containing protein [Hyphomonas sp.]